jgi:hypothetical protein
MGCTVNRAVGTPRPDDERDQARRDSGRPFSEPKHPSQVTPSDRPARRAQGSENRSSMFWPLAATALVFGVALLTFQATHSPFAVIVSSTVTGLIVLMSDYYTD